MITQFGGEKSGHTDTTQGTATGITTNPIGAIFGCPDKIGMAAISGTPKYTFCYQIKRPMGMIVLVGGAIGLFVLLTK